MWVVVLLNADALEPVEKVVIGFAEDVEAHAYADKINKDSNEPYQAFVYRAECLPRGWDKV